MRSVVSYTLRSDGTEFAQSYKVKSIVVVNEVNRIPRAHIFLLDGDASEQDFPISNQDFFKPGKKLEIDFGYESDLENVFKGVIVKISIKVRESSGSYLEVICKHPVVKLTTKKKNHFFYDATDNDAITQILEEAGISAGIDGMKDVKHVQLVQYESTSWDFMIARAEVNGKLVMFDNEKLKIASPSMDGSDVLKCQYGANVLSFDAVMDSESQFSSVESKGWSSSDQDLISADGEQDFKNKIGNISSDELASVLNDEPYILKHVGNLSVEELTQWAKSKATKNELAKIIGNVSIQGVSKIYPGTIVELAGFGNRFSGRAFVTGVRHEMAQGGWTSHLQFGLPSTWFSQQQNFNALPAGGIMPAISGLQIGIVTQLENDPDNEYRIKVRMPIISNDEEGVWASVARIYAGDNFGICFTPEIDDEVVVGFLNDDPRKAIVLGALHSSAKASPLAFKDTNHFKGIVSRNDLRMIWDDDKKIITISTPAGHHITLDDNGKKITIEDSNQNKIELGDQGIEIASAKDLKLSAKQNIELQGINIQCKADGKFTAEGNAGAEVKTNSIAVLKGSLVQIN